MNSSVQEKEVIFIVHSTNQYTDLRKTTLLIPWLPPFESMDWLRRDWLWASHLNRDPKAALLFLMIPSVTHFTHPNRKNCDKVTCLLIALPSGTLKIKQATKHKTVKTHKHSISASYSKFTVLTWIFASASCFDSFTRNFWYWQFLKLTCSVEI